MTPAFMDDVLVRGLGVRYVLVGDDFRFGKAARGDYAMLDAAPGARAGFDVARMMSYGARFAGVQLGCASGVGPGQWRRRRRCWAALLHQRPCGAWAQAGATTGESAPGQGDGVPTLNVLYPPWPAASGILVRCTACRQSLPAWPTWVSRPSLDASDVNGGRVLLEVHCCTGPQPWGARGLR